MDIVSGFPTSKLDDGRFSVWSLKTALEEGQIKLASIPDTHLTLLQDSRHDLDLLCLGHNFLAAEFEGKVKVVDFGA